MNWNFTKDRIDALIELARKYDSNIRFNILKPIQPQHFKLVPTKEQVLENYKYLFEKCDTVESLRVTFPDACIVTRTVLQ